MVGFGEAVKRGFSGYATFSGRSTRAEFWWWALFYWLVTVIPYIGVFASMDWNTTADGAVEGSGGGASALWLGLLFLIQLALLLPTLSVTVRRLHDTSRSGWWWWIGVICGVWLLILMLLPGTPSQNQYG